MRDNIFNKTSPKKKFVFNEKVANVFDDMLNRSVPFYSEVTRMTVELISAFHKEGGHILDIGTSLGRTLSALRHALPDAKLTGVDSSESMIKKATVNLKDNNCKLICSKIQDIEIPKSEAIILNYTLQFIEPSARPHLLKKIYDSLSPGGIIIITEKVKTGRKKFDNLTVDLYYNFKKRNGYSELEISQKRDALEKVLRSSTSNNYIKLLENTGFKYSDIFFKWHNFASFIAVK